MFYKEIETKNIRCADNTNTDLKDKCVKCKKELWKLQTRYNNTIQAPTLYYQSKRLSIFRRHPVIKSIIEGCIVDHNTHFYETRETDRLKMFFENTKKRNALSDIETEVENMQVTEMEGTFKEVQRQLTKTKLQQRALDDALARLEEEYNASMHTFIPFRRYRARKNMLRYFLRNSAQFVSVAGL